MCRESERGRGADYTQGIARVAGRVLFSDDVPRVDHAVELLWVDVAVAINVSEINESVEHLR